jgi:hypothetical protein
MYSVFCSQRDVILSTVITHEIGHDILYDAQSALRSSRFNPRGLLKPQTLEWITTYQVKMNSEHSLSGRSLGLDALPLWRMHQDVKFLADLFVRERLQIIIARGFEVLENTEPAIQRYYGPEYLSSTEKMRIYRSIYRYMIYGNLFYFDQRRPGVVKMYLPYAQDQSHSFLTLFPAWQVEELSCVNDFIHDKVLEKWQEVEDNFYALLAADSSSWDINREDPWNSRWEDDFFSHSIKVNYHEEWQRYLATVSLSDLRDIFTSKDDELLQVVQKHTHRLPHDFLTEALDEDPYHSALITPEYEVHEQALASGATVQFQGDVIDQPNEGWLWSHGYQPCELYVQSTREFPIGEGLRRFEYVFWDSNRLRGSGLIQKKSVYPCLNVHSYCTN